MRSSRILLLLPLLAGALLACPPVGGAALAQGLASADSIHLVNRAIDAMGGLETLRRLHSTRIVGFEHANMLEQSERPEGPYLAVANDFDELRDLSGVRLHRTTTARSIVMPPAGMTIELVVADGMAANRFGERSLAAGPGIVDEAEESLVLGPERVLLTARVAADLRGAGMTRLQGVEHDIVAFSWNGRSVSVYLNRHTDLPTAVQWVRVFDDGFWGLWGDVTARVEYSLWHLENGGLMYPRQWNESRNGMPYRDRTILSLEANVPVGDGLSLPPETRAEMKARAAMSLEQVRLGVDFRGNAREPEVIAPGVTQIRGMWNIALIEQADGILVLEAPISSRYSEQVAAEVERRFPGKSLEGVITTSDAWPHIGGIREYVARGVPIHALDLNVPLLERVIDAPRTRRPDRLAGFADARPDFRPITTATTVGSGVDRVVLYPIRGEGGERMVAVYFPAHRLLYASDLIQAGQGNGFFMPSYLAEVEALVNRESLAVDTVFAMHMEPAPWQSVLDALADIRARDLNGDLKRKAEE